MGTGSSAACSAHRVQAYLCAVCCRVGPERPAQRAPRCRPHPKLQESRWNVSCLEEINTIPGRAAHTHAATAPASQHQGPARTPPN